MQFESIDRGSLILRFLSPSFEYVEPPDGAYGAFVNDSWNGLVRMVIARVSINYTYVTL